MFTYPCFPSHTVHMYMYTHTHTHIHVQGGVSLLGSPVSYRTVHSRLRVKTGHAAGSSAGVGVARRVGGAYNGGHT